MGRHGAELPALPAGPGISGLPDYCLRGNLRSSCAEHRSPAGYLHGNLDLYGLHSSFVLYPVQDRIPVQIHIQCPLMKGGIKMAYVPIPKDLTKVKTKVLFNLTKRQLICFCAGALIGVLAFFLLKNFLGSSAASMCMIVLMLPFFLMALYEKNGRPLEKVVWDMIQVSFKLFHCQRW